MISLKVKGNLVPRQNMTQKEKIEMAQMEPLDYIMNFIQSKLNVVPKSMGSKVLVLQSGTGSGKSTTIPPEIYNRFFAIMSQRNILVTQPRILTAIDIPYQIIKYHKNIQLGNNIGYQTGIIQRKPIKGILFCTIGVLQQQLMIMEDDAIIGKYSFIIIDEVHDRSLQTDTIMFLVKRFLERNYKNLRCPFFILMSATLDETVFMDYFDCPKEHFIKVQGLTYPIQDNFTKYPLSDYVTYAVDMVKKIHLENLTDIKNSEVMRDIIVFVQGKRDSTKIIDALNLFNSELLSQEESKFGPELTKIKERIDKNAVGKLGGEVNVRSGHYSHFYICPINVSRDNYNEGGREYQNMFASLKQIQVPIYDDKGNVRRYVTPTRKVFVGTNVAETGITIETLKYCIDTGMVQSAEFNPVYGTEILLNKPVSKASSLQRRGRVGRKAPGFFYPCYSSETFMELQEQEHAKIIMMDITDMILSLIISESETVLEQVQEPKNTNRAFLLEDTFQMSSFQQLWYKLKSKKKFLADKMDFLQYPSADSMIYSIEKLYGLGFIDHTYTPTLYGWLGARVRKIKIESIRMIFAGYHAGANILDLITMAVMIENFTKPRKYKPRNVLGLPEEQNYYYNKVLFADEIIENLFIWYEYMGLLDKMADSELKKINSPFAKLRDWCKDNQFHLADFYMLSEARDELVANLLTIGINPYYNGLGLEKGTYNLCKILKRNMREGMDEIVKLKKCIYEGYRYNLAIWNQSARRYYSVTTHLPISLNTPLVKPISVKKDGLGESSDVVPQIILYGNVIYKEGFTRNQYDFYASDISVIDGFIDIDLDYYNH